MKRLQNIAVYLVLFGLAGVSSLRSDEPAKIQGYATVRTVKGKATYTSPDGITKRLKTNIELEPGTRIDMGADSFAYLNVNGLTSAVRLDAKTTLILNQMERIGTAREGATETKLNLRVGSMVGQVKKVSGDSRYEIETPDGVAGVRGTDFAIEVAPVPKKKFAATFICMTGQLIAAAIVDNALQTKTINAGESWTPGAGSPQSVPPERLKKYTHWENAPGLRPNAGPPDISILPVFPNGAPPLGPSGPPRK